MHKRLRAAAGHGRRSPRASVLFATAVLFALLAPGRSAARDDTASVEYFEKHVRPLLVANCYTCHSADTNSRGGLRVDDRNGLLTGGGRGPAIVPGKPAESLLIKAVSHTGALKMPPERRLSDENIAILKKWIRDGAAWTKVESLPSDQHVTADYQKLRKQHWAWQPLHDPQPPAMSHSAWPRDAIDRFLLARLANKGIKPVGDARKLPLIRRATFDLTGLPPTLAEIDAFLADQSVSAFERLVDRLLASPAFGERWGRHWLDVARYAESTGSARNLPFPHAWRYRDYVINAFNTDKPYDQFIREQIAGDLLPAATPGERAERLIATGFLALGVKDVNQRFKVRYIMDNIDEQIDTVSRSVLALTVSCGRCHDHKFDPIPTADYYALAGIFRSTDLCASLRNKMGGGGLDYYDTGMLLRIGPETSAAKGAPEQLARVQTELAQARDDFAAIQKSADRFQRVADGTTKAAAAKQRVNRLQAELARLNDPAAHGPVALGVRDAQSVGDTEVRIRGIAEKHGPVAPRGFLSVVHYPGQPAVNVRQSGRLQLAEWLTSPQNPLASRVIVNRVWHHLFGDGLVKSVDNFGVNGDLPSHPELLDHLATRFIRDGWSIKRLVRSIVLTRAYQLSSDASPENMAADPENEFVWRHSPRRLDAEEIRDATLSAAGQLDLAQPEGSPAMNLPVIELTNNGAQARRLTAFAQASRHRNVYLPLLRGLTPNSLAIFDFAEQGMVTGDRDTTTVAPQALYLLNDPFVRTQSRALADRLLRRDNLSDAERIDLAYRLTMGRSSSTAESGRAAEFLVDYAAALKISRIAARSTPASAMVTSGKSPRAKNQKRATRKVAARSVRPQNTKEAQSAQTIDERVPEPSDSRTAAWAAFCQALFDSAEFRYLQ
ncbi:MAG TPA: PSD1 and planctomycete cytochrome C domain-containing protein [Planctomycetaceae bacterium]|nr:PSD1 and planctomycete cytochrome C domain-containing protein [Planctomycetaceae bacterium]